MSAAAVGGADEDVLENAAENEQTAGFGAEVEECMCVLGAQYQHLALEPGALAAVFQLDLQRPSYVFLFQDEAITDTNFTFYLSQLEALYASPEPFCLVMDFARMRWPPMTFFWKQVAFLRNHIADTRRCVIWSLLIVRNAEMRNLLRLLFHIVPPQRPFWVVDSAALRSQGQDVPRTAELLLEA